MTQSHLIQYFQTVKYILSFSPRRGMYHTVDATVEDMGPIRDNQIQMSLYYVCFVVVFSFFFLNMFVALIIVTFQEQGEKEMDGCELDRNQVSITSMHFKVVIF